METSSASNINYSSYIASRTHEFTGREWVFRKIAEWLADAAGKRTFLLSGGPGTGKTAIASRVVQMSLGEIDATTYPNLRRDSLTYFHFCQAGREGTLSPLAFVEALSGACANRYSAFRAALESTASRQIIINSLVNVQGDVQAGALVTGAHISQIHIEITGGDARPVFDQAVRRPLEALCAQSPTERIVVLVDSLDEALGFSAENNIVQLLKLANDFPPQVRFFLTCRSNSVRVFDLVGRPTLDLIADAPAGLDEVRLYAASHLHAVTEPGRSSAAERIAEKSKGNFLYAYHVLNDLAQRGTSVRDADTLDLPDELEGVYRKFLERELASNATRWNDLYRPLLGPIAVARGDGLTKAQLIGITNLAEDTATDVLKTCGEYLVGGDAVSPYRIYHESFRDFLLGDEKFTVFPAERHAAIARYLQDTCGANWGTCNDPYALRYAPLHWADAATLSDQKREIRTQALIELTGSPKYQRRFERRIGDLPALHEHLHRAVEVAALNSRDDMVPWLLKAARGYIAFRRDYLRAESVVTLADEGKLDQAEARLRLFTEIDEDWQIAARLIIAWLGVERNAAAAEKLRGEILKSSGAVEPIPLLSDRVKAAIYHQPSFGFELQQCLSLEVSRELVKRVSGQKFDRELLLSVNPSLITVSQFGPQSEVIDQRGYAAGLDAPILVNAAREHGLNGTLLMDEYIDAHAGYNYVEYRNRSLWIVLHAVLRHHPNQDWVKERLRRILVAALSGGGVDFSEMLPLTTGLLHQQATGGDAGLWLDGWLSIALGAADALHHQRGVNDSWGNHKRRLTGLMELSQLVLGDRQKATVLLKSICSLPGGFAGFQAPALLRVADAIRACRMNAPGLLEKIVEDALRTAHHIQDYHFCARVTARCNALKRWHLVSLSGQGLADTVRRFAASPNEGEFSADHVVHERYSYRDENDPDTLSIASAREAATLEQLVEVFQRTAVEFRRLNPQYGLAQTLDHKTAIRVPDPGFVPLLAVHLAARVLADDSLEDERGSLIRAVVPVATNNPTAFDTILSYLLIANQPDDPELVEEMVTETGPVVMANVAASTAQIGPDPVTPS
jgi:hypothetical protein